MIALSALPPHSSFLLSPSSSFLLPFSFLLLLPLSPTIQSALSLDISHPRQHSPPLSLVALLLFFPPLPPTHSYQPTHSHIPFTRIRNIAHIRLTQSHKHSSHIAPLPPKQRNHNFTTSPFLSIDTTTNNTPTPLPPSIHPSNHHTSKQPFVIPFSWQTRPTPPPRPIPLLSTILLRMRPSTHPHPHISTYSHTFPQQHHHTSRCQPRPTVTITNINLAF